MPGDNHRFEIRGGFFLEAQVALEEEDGTAFGWRERRKQRAVCGVVSNLVLDRHGRRGFSHGQVVGSVLLYLTFNRTTIKSTFSLSVRRDTSSSEESGLCLGLGLHRPAIECKEPWTKHIASGLCKELKKLLRSHLRQTLSVGLESDEGQARSNPNYNSGLRLWRKLIQGWALGCRGPRFWC